jgi:two-component system, OmpR family, sensor histidine kinase TctE
MSKKPPSLKRPLIIQPLIFQLAILLLSCTVIMALATRADVGGLYTDESITPVIAQVSGGEPLSGATIQHHLWITSGQ